MHESDKIFLDERELISRVRSSDSKAFETIYRRYAAKLMRYARMNIKDPADCEEIVQEIFESLWVRRKSLKIASLSHYLSSSVRYRVIRYFQHSKVKQHYAEHYRFFENVYDSIEKDEREDLVSIQENLEICLHELPERCRIVIQLRLHENMSNSEIADRMKITKKTVEVYIFKAFSHLRSSYNKIYPTT